MRNGQNLIEQWIWKKSDSKNRILQSVVRIPTIISFLLKSDLPVYFNN